MMNDKGEVMQGESSGKREQARQAVSVFFQDRTELRFDCYTGILYLS